MKNLPYTAVVTNFFVCVLSIKQVEPGISNPASTSNVTSGSPLRNSQSVSNNQDQEEQMQTAAEPNNAFSTRNVVGPQSDQNSSNPNLQNPLQNTSRVGELITDDEDLPQVAPLHRESSSEGVSVAV